MSGGMTFIEIVPPSLDSQAPSRDRSNLMPPAAKPKFITYLKEKAEHHSLITWDQRQLKLECSRQIILKTIPDREKTIPFIGKPTRVAFVYIFQIQNWPNLTTSNN